MNLNVLLNIGNESYTGDEAPKSLLDEMMEEIGTESEIDNNIYDTEIACVNAAAAIVENVYVAMAEKECAVEGANPLEIYRGFGLEGALLNTVGQEAISDVVKRRAYSGVAQIKSLINTLIAWVKRLLGLSANTKKIFKSLAEKAKKIKKEVVKARGNFSAKQLKNGDDKEYEKEMPEFLGDASYTGTYGLKTAKKAYTDLKGFADQLNSITNAWTNTAAFTNETKAAVNPKAVFASTDKENISEKMKTWKEDTKNTETGNDIFDKIIAGLNELVSNKSAVDINKSFEKAQKLLEKLRDKMEKDDSTSAGTNGAKYTDMQKVFADTIASASLNASFMNLFAKFYVKVADELFTNAKWIIMKAA
jgi:hypothetical protein|nr:MAG TPA: hypothetical protein [Caudoviricetes sp.]